VPRGSRLAPRGGSLVCAGKARLQLDADEDPGDDRDRDRSASAARRSLISATASRVRVVAIAGDPSGSVDSRMLRTVGLLGD
jgi:hypothetical protein